MQKQYSAKALLDKLVSFKTVSRDSNLEMIEFIKDYLKSYGIESHLIFNDLKTKANLFAQIGPNVEGGILLSGHTDVVPIDGQSWDSNPFRLIEKNNRLYGRGSCDMKGFNALVLAAIPSMKKAKMKKPIQIAFSYDEEVGCLGAPAMIKQIKVTFPKAAAVIVGEPTMMNIVNGHKTSVGLETQVRGFEVHSSLMYNGVSAVMNAAKLVNWISQQTEKNSAMEIKEENRKFDPPFTTLHVGTINGGTAGNITAKDCRFSLDIRCLPSESSAAWVKKYQNYAKTVVAKMQNINSTTYININTAHFVPGLQPEANGFAEAIVRQVTRQNGTEMVSYGTEAGQFQGAGYSTIICGPGSIKQAHQANEYLEVSQLKKGELFISDLIKSVC